MKRLHVHVRVSDLGDSVSFYSTLFGSAPDVLKTDYAKWMLDDPRVNFAISEHAETPGIDHLGIQVDDDAELADVTGRLSAAGRRVVEQRAAACCYATSDKGWATDPQGVAWESFHTTGEIALFGEDRAPERACCAPGRAPAG